LLENRPSGTCPLSLKLAVGLTVCSIRFPQKSFINRESEGKTSCLLVSEVVKVMKLYAGWEFLNPKKIYAIDVGIINAPYPKFKG
jgi:hypothetical protein